MTNNRTQEGRGMTRRAKLLAAGVIAAAAVTVAACFVKHGPSVEPVASDDGKAKERLFRDWPKPDAVVIISGQQHGYLDPCGCSRPQVGGLVRRYNFIEELKGRGWPILAVDAGDIAQRRGPAGLPNVQGVLKYKIAMEALKRMGYTAVTVGEYEAAMTLQTALSEFRLNNPLPEVLIANLKDRDVNFPEQQAAWKIETIKGTDLKVGIVGVVGPSVARNIKELGEPNVEFLEVSKEVDKALKEMDAKNKPDLRVLLYQGQPEEARACAKNYPNRFPIIVCISTFDEPPSEAEIVKDAGTMIVTVGHKGKYVGAVGVNRTGKDNPKFQLRYQLVRLGEEYLTPDGKEKGHPIMEGMEQYTKDLKRENYLAKYRPTKLPSQVDKPADQKPEYVGSDRCKKCHEHAYEIWEKSGGEKKSGHAHAYQTLVDAKKPSNRQYDGECIVCHTVGFTYESGFRNEKDTPKLINVGCESCHGPASLHVKKPDNAALREALNPWKHDAKRIEIDLCVKCHDPDNDVHWSFEKWKKIIHNNPKDE